MSGIESFSGFEVIRAAMEVERQGKQFYAALSTQAHSELSREIFAMMAQDEITHLQTLEKMVTQFQNGAYWDNEELFLPYLNRFSSERIFPSTQEVSDVLTMVDAECRALDLAIGAEQKFAEYFQLAADHSLDEDGRKAFAWLAEEETRHAEILKKRRAKLISSSKEESSK